MKRYLLFAYPEYYPSGGFKDFRNSFNTIEEANAEYRKLRITRDVNEAHIVDCETWQIIKEFYSDEPD